MDKFFAGEDPLAQKIAVEMDEKNPFGEIIGVGDVKEGALDIAPEPTVYYVHAHLPYVGMEFVGAHENDPFALAAPVRRLIHDLDAAQPVARFRTMESVARETFARQRFSAVLLASFSPWRSRQPVCGVARFASRSARRSARRVAVGVRYTRIMPDQEIATLGGGCFWCLEAVYQEMKGVESVVSGYMGGRMQNPSYEQVCRGNTGHIEVVQVTFDPGVVSYSDVLDVFFAIHDPTTKDRQGNDVGEQYRSVIFYHSEAQNETAEAKIRKLDSEHIWSKPIVTKVQPADTFYRAEDYHQNYYRTNPKQSYCAYIVEPKVRKFREKLKPLIAPAHGGNG